MSGEGVPPVALIWDNAVTGDAENTMTPLASPRSAAAESGHRTRDWAGSAANLDRLEFVAGEKPKGTAIGRPERKDRVVGVGQRMGFRRH